jgi:hypothetical protein
MRFFLAAGAILLGACDSSSRGVTCEQVFEARICHGLLSPRELDEGITDVQSQGVAAQHFFCYPEASASRGRLLIHLVGTGSDPARDHRLAEYACSRGFAAIVPMYENTHDARGTCGQASECYEAMRKEIVYGQDLWPAPIAVNPANSLLNRIQTMLERLATRESRFPEWGLWSERFAAREFAAVTVAGHSQGSGHALLLARDFAVERLVMLGGLTDRLDSGQPTNTAVEWIANWSASQPKTSADRLFGYIHEDDDIAIFSQVIANYDSIGMRASTCVFSSTGAYPPECRRFHIPSAGCGPLNAHLNVIAARFDSNAPCSPGRGTNDNTATWDFLLTAP